MKRRILYGGVLAIYLLSAGFANAAMDHVVIYQVQVEGDGGAADEFIELYNPTSEAVSLEGWSLQYKSASGGFPLASGKKNLPNVILPAHGHYLVANTGYNATTTADLVHGSFSLSGSANGATIYLVNTSDYVIAPDHVSIVDKVGYGSSASNTPETANAPLPGSEEALVRFQDTDNNLADFRLQAASPGNASSTVDVSTTTPDTTASSTIPSVDSNPAATSGSSGGSGGQPSILTKSYFVKISEILPNPDGEDEGREQVEVENTGTVTVNLDGWWLQDRTDTGPKPNAYRFENLSLPPFGVYVVTFAKGKFVLNNTGGDEVNLFFSDKTPADTVAYAEEAKEGWSYQKIDGAWVWQRPSPGQKNFKQATGGQSSTASAPHGSSPSGQKSAATTPPDTFYSIQSFLNEILANPKGADEGQEWVEFYNPSEAEENLQGFILDDSGKAGPSSNAWVLPDSPVPAKGYLMLRIPEDRFTLNNSGQEVVRFFAPDKTLLAERVYEQADEGKSFQKNSSGQWVFGLPSPGTVNVAEMPAAANLKIFEVLPYPEEEQDEFIELANLSSGDVSLAGYVLKVGSRTYAFEDDAVIKAGDLLALYGEDLGLRLSNSGQKVLIQDAFGRPVDSLEYTKAKRGEAYAATRNGFVWTRLPTPGEENRVEHNAALPVIAVATTGPDSIVEVQLAEATSETGNGPRVLGAIDTSRMPDGAQDAGKNDPSASHPAGYLLLAAGAMAVLCFVGAYFLRLHVRRKIGQNFTPERKAAG